MTGKGPGPGPAIHTAPSNSSEDDGFGDHDVEGCEPALPEAVPLPDPGCPNLLGWSGNRFCEDYQYGLFQEDLVTAPAKHIAKKIFIAVLGDGAAEVRAPRADDCHGCSVLSVALSENDVIGYGAEYLPDLLQAEADDSEICYCIMAPLARSSLRKGAAGATRDSVARGYDDSVRRILGHLVERLPTWKVLVAVPVDSTWLEDFAATAGGARKWAGWQTKVGSFEARVRTRHWISTPTRTAGVTAETWPSAVRRLVAASLAEDLKSATRLVATVTEALEQVSLTSHGKVKRHVVRGPPLWDPRAAKLAEDIACPAGMRDPAELWRTWPALWATMAPIAEVILKARAENPHLQGLTGCLGKPAGRPPPEDTHVRDLRLRIGIHLNLDAAKVDAHSRYSTWRYELVQALQHLSDDPDVVLPSWLRDGAPMGIRCPLVPGNGIFPSAPSERTVEPDVVLKRTRQKNHASFCDRQGLARPPGHDVIQDHVSAGFGLLYVDQESAEQHLQSKITAAPLGCITKAKEGGGLKHRVIQDLKANGVNLACSTPERQVLPTVYQHAQDLAVLGQIADQNEDISIKTLVLDVKDAFMGVPLHAAERPFNACATDLDLRRGREPHFEGETEVGKFVVWNVLGFGGKPNPLVFARVAAFAARTGQALFRPAPDAPGCPVTGHARLQQYVDDPVFSVAGTDGERELAVDLLLLWWLALGVPLAWAKGTWTAGQHRWIGADFLYKPGPDAACVMTVPQTFVDKLYDLLAPLSVFNGHVAEKDIEKILGKCGRLSYMIPATKPFVTALWGAFAASRTAAQGRRLEAPRGRHAARRYAVAARWIRTLLRPTPSAPDRPLLPLETLVAVRIEPITLRGPCLQLDASPWGGGVVLIINEVPVEHASCSWSAATAARLKVELGSSKGQTTWEYLIIWLALEVWGTRFAGEGLAILGDNMAALNGAISLRGRAEIAQITRELAWRKVRNGWRYACGHLPAEHNDLADCLSRLTAPEGNRKNFPHALGASVEKTLPDPESLWVCV